MNLIKHIEPNCRRPHGTEDAVATRANAIGPQPPARGARALWRLVRRPLLVGFCFAVAALTATQAGVAPSQAAPSVGTLIAQIRLLPPLHGALRVGDTVQLAAAGANVKQAHFLWRLLRRPKTSRAAISDRDGIDASFVADVPGVYVVELTVRVGSRRATATLSVTAGCATDPLSAVNTIANVNGQVGMTVGSCFFPENQPTQFQVLYLNRGESLLPYSVTNSDTGYVSENQGYDVTSFGISVMTTDLSTLPTDGSVLVLVALPASAPQVPSDLVDQLNSALAEIGGVLPGSWILYLESQPHCWASNTPQCYNPNPPTWTEGTLSNAGSFSVIGVPGMSAGNAWHDSAAQEGTQQGALVGYLTPGVTVPPPGVALPTVGAYSFVFGADQYVLVDSCVSGAPSACVIGVGDQTFPPTAANGLNVVVLDRATLEPIKNETLTSTSALWQALLSGNPPPQQTGGHSQLQTTNTVNGGFFSDQIVVIMQTVGTGMLTYGNDPTLQQIDQLGGTPETFAAAITQGKPYALIGVASNLPWHGRGIESSPLISPGQPCTIALNQPCAINSLELGQSRGVLSRDRLARYTPHADDPTGMANLELFQIVYQNPTPWPYTYDANSTDTNPQQVVAGYAAAIAYIADTIGVGYCDIRSGYPSMPPDWSDYINTNVTYPSNSSTSPPQPPNNSSANNPCSSYYSSYNSSENPNYTSFPNSTTFSSILSQLQTEFGYVTGVRGLIGDLESPFTSGEAEGQNIIATAASNIYNSVQPPASSETSLYWLSIFDGVMGVLSETALPDASVFGLVGDSGALAALLIGNSSTASGGPGSSASTILAQASQLSGQLTNQYQAHLDALAQLQNILVADWGKLEATGSMVNQPDWAWSSTTTSNAAAALNATTGQAVYSALLPATWQLYNLKPDLTTEFSSANVTTFVCGWQTCSPDPDSPSGQSCVGATDYPFANAVAYKQSATTPPTTTYGNQFQSRVQMTTTGSIETSNTEVWTFGSVDGADFPTYPSSSTTLPTTSLTDDIFSAISAGGAAAYPPAWYRSTYNPPSHVVCSQNSTNFSNDPLPNTNNAQAPVVIGPDEANETGG